MNTRNYTLDGAGQLNNFAIEPKMYVDETVNPGFTEYAEKVNGRFAMIGFASLLILEIFTGHGFIGLITNL